MSETVEFEIKKRSTAHTGILEYTAFIASFDMHIVDLGAV